MPPRRRKPSTMRRAELALTTLVSLGLCIMALRTGGLLGILFAALAIVAFAATLTARD